MVNHNYETEMVIICDEKGIVREILYPEDHQTKYFLTGQSFLYYIEPQSLSKALNFMALLTTAKFASNFEVYFKLENEIQKMFLSGFLRDDMYMVIASGKHDDISRLNEELLKINSEQINQLRMILKERVRDRADFSKASTDYFDEISKLNNELMNSKRELAKKNQELSKLNMELERLATRDPLTGLYNRRTLFEKFKEEKKRANRLSYPLSLAVIDLNHFKKVNDQLGHLAGDELLKSFAGLLMRMTRENFDQLFSIGGDEFLILFANCPIEDATGVLNRINLAFTELSDIASLAFGVVEVNLECTRESDDVDLCILKADALMFEHKKSSR